MKASCVSRPIPCASPLISSLFHKFCSFKSPTKSHLISSSSPFSSLSTQININIPHKPKTPICLKPPIYSTTSADLNTFISWAKTLISSIGSTFVDLDNGPDPTLLHRELKWFLDDAVEDPSGFDGTAGVVLGRKQSKVVNLRESLETMYDLWEERMVKRRPFQYIVGCEHWKDLVLSVEDGVLIPRPETGAIVDVVEGLGKEVDGFKKGGGGVWADLGTGSGALAIGIARVLGADVKVVATDVSPIAVSVAKYNVERYGLQTNGEKQCKFHAEYLENESGDSICNVNIVSDFAGVPRFVTGHRK